MSQKIAIITSGGDAPGMNAAVRAVVRAGNAAGFKVYGVDSGYTGLLEAGNDPSRIRQLGTEDVADIVLRGGTILRSARELRMQQPEWRQIAAKNLKDLGIGWLVVIGGNGSFTGALLLKEECGVNVIGIPATIDNDLAYTEWTIGLDTAANTALTCITHLRDTMNALNRVCFVEIMGRHCGDLAMYAGIAGGAENVLVREVYEGKSTDEIAKIIYQNLLLSHRRGKRGSIITVAEGLGDGRITKGQSIAQLLAESVQALSDADNAGLDVKSAVLGHVQRGGNPSARDVILASQFGAHAIRLIQQGQSGKMIGSQNDMVIEEDITLPKLDPDNERRPFKQHLFDLALLLGQ